MTRVSKNIAKELTYINKIKALEKKVAKLEENEKALLEWLEKQEIDSKPRVNLNSIYGDKLRHSKSKAFQETIEYINNQNK